MRGGLRSWQRGLLRRSHLAKKGMKNFDNIASGREMAPNPVFCMAGSTKAGGTFVCYIFTRIFKIPNRNNPL